MTTIIENFDMRKATTFHLPATARWFVEYDTIDDLPAILSDQRFASLPHLHIGSGSNLLFTGHYDGVVLHCNRADIDITSDNGTEVKVKATTGVVWDDFVAWCVDHELYGAENLSLIPGEVGASAVQNIGAYGAEVKDIIESVETYDTITGTTRLFSRDECDYGYRDSLFKRHDIAGRYIVTSVTYTLKRTPSFNLEYGPLRSLATESSLTLRRVRDTIIDIRRAKLPDPDEIGSAGSFFKNPIIGRELFESMSNRYPGMPHYLTDSPDNIKIPAGWLIEQSGLKGCSIGGAQVYPRQCLVIVNNGDATPTDVVTLFRHVQTTVYNKFGIMLSPEVNIIS